MKLTIIKAEKFWLAYDRYTAETTKIDDRKYDLTNNYADKSGHMTDQQAVSTEEIQQFSQLYRDDARPTQRLSGRIVLETQ